MRDFKNFIVGKFIAWTLCIAAIASADELPKFEPQVVDDKIAIGYGIALQDVDGDGKRDILLADKNQFVWYRNPNWERFVMAEKLTERDNVCIAARDIDGDGRAEVAVGAEWNPGDTVNSGAVFYLQAPEDRTQRWTPVRLHHEPVVHRMRWVRIADDRYVLVVAPLHGRGNQRGEGAGARLMAYSPPAEPNGEWVTTLLDDALHVTHNFDRGQWVGNDTTPEEILYLGREEARLIQYQNGNWNSETLHGVAGGGEIRMGRNHDDSKFLVTIEPFHGDKLATYLPENTGLQRTLRANDLNQGHAIAIGELVPGNPGPEIVYGWRNPNAEETFGIRLEYVAENGTWNRQWIDQNGMACEDLRVADLDGDGRLDIVAAGRSTHNLKIYWNRKNAAQDN